MVEAGKLAEKSPTGMFPGISNSGYVFREIFNEIVTWMFNEIVTWMFNEIVTWMFNGIVTWIFHGITNLHQLYMIYQI
jgi:hypothetical protein